MRVPPLLIAMCLSSAACFSPRDQEGSACTTACPGGLTCVAGRCVHDGAPPDAGTDAPAACPAGYVRSAVTGSSYRVVGTAASQPSAAADCAGDHPRAHLAIADDAAENDVLDRLATNDTWLGITDEAADRTWVTVLGAAQTFFAWGRDQPNGGANESCAFLANGVWQDTSCALAKPYVCECQ